MHEWNFDIVNKLFGRQFGWSELKCHSIGDLIVLELVLSEFTALSLPGPVGAQDSRIFTDLFNHHSDKNGLKSL